MLRLIPGGRREEDENQQLTQIDEQIAQYRRWKMLSQNQQKQMGHLPEIRKSLKSVNEEIWEFLKTFDSF